MTSYSFQYARQSHNTADRPPAIAVRYFYTSPLAIDDPLSPLPPPLPSSSASHKVPPRPFSAFDNATLDKAWMDVRTKRLRFNEKASNEKRSSRDVSAASASTAAQDIKRGSTTNYSAAEAKRRSIAGSVTSGAIPPSPRNRPQRMPSNELLSTRTRANTLLDQKGPDGGRSNSLRDAADSSYPPFETSTTTGNPFIRAPLRTEVGSSAARSRSTSVRPAQQKLDSYNWGDDPYLAQDVPGGDEFKALEPAEAKDIGPIDKVPVGVSRLHEVVVPSLLMEPIYWSPVNDIASVVRATWFYADNMLPVEVNVANMLEAGFVELRAWSDTWKDELTSAVEVGAFGEQKIMHRLWPTKPKVPVSRPGTSRESVSGQTLESVEHIPVDPEKEREVVAANAGDLIDTTCGPDGPDNKAAGAAPYGYSGSTRIYRDAGVIYANEREAYILRPGLQPSSKRRPLADYIRKGRSIGIRVVRGFDQQAWDKLHPPNKLNARAKAREGVSSSAGGLSPEQRQNQDSTISGSLRPQVTDLVLVVHGIGQKLSERVESYHFTHAINTFRREVNVELGTDSVKANLRSDLGGIMVLPVNWRLTLKFEEGGYRPDDFEEDPALNVFGLSDITPDTLPNVRGIVSDVMLDIPYYLSEEYKPKMLAAVQREANKIYRLWCANNPGFADWGRVHMVAHSLGSLMALDILSNQPTHVKRDLRSLSIDAELPKDHLLFDTHSVFFCGSPSGFFLLMNKSSLLPRRDRKKADGIDTPGVSGEQGTYGCLAVDNLYNVVNPYDPVAYRLNATVDAAYASALKTALVPSSSSSWFNNPFTRSQSTANASAKPSLVTRLPSNVELETHNFTREEIAEKRFYALNDNGQIDYFLRYGGGTFEIQYLTMLGAHSSYWLSRDFVRMIVVEIGREQSREGTLPGMRAQKKREKVA